MYKNEPDSATFDRAFDLLISMHEQPDDLNTLERIRVWRAAHPHNEIAWREALEIHTLVSKIAHEREARKAARAQRFKSRRHVIYLAGGAACALGIGAFAAPGLMPLLRPDFSTSTAEVRRISIPGAQMSLGPRSSLRTPPDQSGSRIELLDGMVYIETTSAGQPLRASGAGMDMLAADAAFEISHEGSLFRLAVGGGNVTLRAPGPAPGRLALSSGQRITIDTKNGTTERGPHEPGQLAAWREGILVLEAETIGAAVARIARWKTGRVVVLSDHLARQRISGTYTLSDPLEALKAVVLPHGGRVREVSPWLTLVSEA